MYLEGIRDFSEFSVKTPASAWTLNLEFQLGLEFVLGEERRGH